MGNIQYQLHWSVKTNKETNVVFTLNYVQNEIVNIKTNSAKFNLEKKYCIMETGHNIVVTFFDEIPKNSTVIHFYASISCFFEKGFDTTIPLTERQEKDIIDAINNSSFNENNKKIVTTYK